jgi:hypothetical protein
VRWSPLFGPPSDFTGAGAPSACWRHFFGSPGCVVVGLVRLPCDCRVGDSLAAANRVLAGKWLKGSLCCWHQRDLSALRVEDGRRWWLHGRLRCGESMGRSLATTPGLWRLTCDVSAPHSGAAGATQATLSRSTSVALHNASPAFPNDSCSLAPTVRRRARPVTSRRQRSCRLSPGLTRNAQPEELSHQRHRNTNGIKNNIGLCVSESRDTSRAVGS